LSCLHYWNIPTIWAGGLLVPRLLADVAKPRTLTCYLVWSFLPAGTWPATLTFLTWS
jgi:hypothetical protein